MRASDLNFRDIKPFVWYDMVDTYYGDFVFIIVRKGEDYHKVFAYSSTQKWFEIDGKITRNDWRSAAMGEIESRIPVKSASIINRQVIKLILSKDVELV